VPRRAPALIDSAERERRTIACRALWAGRVRGLHFGMPTQPIDRLARLDGGRNPRLAESSESCSARGGVVRPRVAPVPGVYCSINASGALNRSASSRPNQLCGLAADRLFSRNQQSWGPSRHTAGHNIAGYHYDPDRVIVELIPRWTNFIPRTRLP